MSASSRAGMMATTLGQESGRHCERSEAIQELLGASRLVDRRVALLLAMTIRSEFSARSEIVIALAAEPEPSPAEQKIGPDGERKERDGGDDHLR